MNKIRDAGLFAGVWGFSLGLEGNEKGKSASSNYKEELNSNYEIVFSNQWEPSSKKQHVSEVYEYRFRSKGHGCHVFNLFLAFLDSNKWALLDDDGKKIKIINKTGKNLFEFINLQIIMLGQIAITTEYFRQYRQRLGFTNQADVKSFFGAKDIPSTVNLDHIRLLNERLFAIINKINNIYLFIIII